MIGSSMMTTEPDIEESHSLRGWFDSIGSDSEFTAHHRTDGAGGATGGYSGGFEREKALPLKDIKESMEGVEPPPEGKFFNTRANIMHIKPDNIAYPSCPNTEKRCQKKVVEKVDGWSCEACQRSWDKPTYR
jgi:replication factor A1